MTAALTVGLIVMVVVSARVLYVERRDAAAGRLERVLRDARIPTPTKGEQ